MTVIYQIKMNYLKIYYRGNKNIKNKAIFIFVLIINYIYLDYKLKNIIYINNLKSLRKLVKINKNGKF